MDIVTLKIVALSFLFFLTATITFLPSLIVTKCVSYSDPNRRRLNGKVISCLNCFSGGVFLAVAFLNLFPQVIMIFHKLAPRSSFPLAEFCVAFGFLLTLSAEQILIDFEEVSSDNRTTVERLAVRDMQMERETLNSASGEDSDMEIAAVLEATMAVKPQPKFHTVFLILTLSFHSLLEGLALGFQDDRDVLLEILAAVFIHKILIAFSVGMNLTQTTVGRKLSSSLKLLFSAMTPAGILLSYSIDKAVSSGSTLAFVSGIGESLATGTFCFVVFIEILPKELKLGRPRLLNLTSLISGFATVCTIMIFEIRRKNLRL